MQGRSIITVQDYGTVHLNLRELMDVCGINRNMLAGALAHASRSWINGIREVSKRLTWTFSHTSAACYSVKLRIFWSIRNNDEIQTAVCQNSRRFFVEIARVFTLDKLWKRGYSI